MWRQSKREYLERYFDDLTKQFEESLKPYNIYDTLDEVKRKRDALDSLTKLVRRWIEEESLKKLNICSSVAATFGGNLYTFGAYRLEFHYRVKDIDVLCVAPRHIHRTEFFTSFCTLLKTQPQVKDLLVDEDAYVPVIKINFDGVHINLVFARLDLKKIPEYLDLKNDELLINLNEKCVRSLNGYRATETILTLIPNTKNFRFTLKVIKLWAQCHNIYSNNFGYMGDLSWAIMVADICQRYPESLPVSLVTKFFAHFSHWAWPIPVLLESLYDLELGLPAWNMFVNASDRNHVMPIISPAYPQQNTAINISTSIKAVIMKELRLGLVIARGVMSENCGWEDLFKPRNFFSSYEHFLLLEATSTEADGQLQWNRVIEKVIFKFTDKLEEYNNILVAHFNRVYYNSVPLSTNNGQPLALAPGIPVPLEVDSNQIKKNIKDEVVADVCSVWFMGLVFKTKNVSLDLTDIATSFGDVARLQAQESHVLRDGMELKVRHVQHKRLHQYVSPELLMSERAAIAPKCNLEALYKNAFRKISQKEDILDSGDKVSESFGKQDILDTADKVSESFGKEDTNK